ncbi:hypothetical protein IJ182_04675 [bacterium]|nr:hypothetical protein [bacterium]
MILYIKNILKNYIHIFILALGLLIFCYPLVFSLFKYLPGNLGDARYINYILEHAYLFIHQTNLHTSFFDLPIFFPHTNTLSYSDMMIGGMILYIPIREIIKDPQNALLIWFILTSILNYYSMYILLRKIFNFNKMSSAIGALIFAFSTPKQNQIGHLQFQTQFYMILSVILFLSINYNKSKSHNLFCFLLCSIFFVIQIYSSFYLGWFMLYGMLIYCIVATVSRKLRPKFLFFIKTYIYEIILNIIIGLILLIPLIKHYLAVGIEFDYNSQNLVSLIGFFTSNSIVDNNILNLSYLFIGENEEYWENVFGIGYITFIAATIGLFYRNKHNKNILLFFILSLSFFVISPLNKLLYMIYPGTSAIRVSPRIILLLLPIFSYGIANFFEKIKNRKIIYIFLIFFVFIELIYRYDFYFWSKLSHQENLQNYKIPQNCNIVFFDSEDEEYDNYFEIYNSGVMWKIIDKVYTHNGYSGYSPQFYSQILSKKCIIKKDYFIDD